MRPGAVTLARSADGGRALLGRQRVWSVGRRHHDRPPDATDERRAHGRASHRSRRRSHVRAHGYGWGALLGTSLRPDAADERCAHRCAGHGDWRPPHLCGHGSGWRALLGTELVRSAGRRHHDATAGRPRRATRSRACRPSRRRGTRARSRSGWRALLGREPLRSAGRRRRDRPLDVADERRARRACRPSQPAPSTPVRSPPRGACVAGVTTGTVSWATAAQPVPNDARKRGRDLRIANGWVA